MDCAIVAVSVDSREHAREVVDSNNLTFSMAHGVTREESEMLGAWWSDDRGGYIQPAEFLLGRGGVVLGSMYAWALLGEWASMRPSVRSRTASADASSPRAAGANRTASQQRPRLS